ncbi:MAG TPA: fructosamine kinase family protein [Abditibacteriaceae bacterium]|jgi:fructosamine-3-kinase
MNEPAPDSTVPVSVAQQLEAQFGALQSVVEIAGGDINRAAQVAVGGENIFVKWNENAPSDLFEVEARGLEMLRAANALRVPQVLAIGEQFLALEYIGEGIIFNRDEWSKRFAEGLATQHRCLAPDAQFGLEASSYLGLMPQQNTPTTSWPHFWRNCRLAPQIDFARERGIGEERLRLLDEIQNRIEQLLDYNARPSLLHGDLWSGNYLAASASAVLVDPAIYYGDREAELGYIELFGGFPANFVAHYNAAWPLEDGYEQRRPVHQLYYLLAHFNLFGEPYGQTVERVCRQILERHGKATNSLTV